MSERKVDDADLSKISGGSGAEGFDNPGGDLGHVGQDPIGGGGQPPEGETPDGGIGGGSDPGNLNNN